MRLYDKGWGYTKIHHHLIKNKLRIGKNRTTVYSVIKKINDRRKIQDVKEVKKLDNFKICYKKYS